MPARVHLLIGKLRINLAVAVSTSSWPPLLQGLTYVQFHAIGRKLPAPPLVIFPTLRLGYEATSAFGLRATIDPVAHGLANQVIVDYN